MHKYLDISNISKLTCVIYLDFHDAEFLLYANFLTHVQK